MTAFQDLMTFQRDTEALGQIAGRLGWDQETMMPEGAARQRGEEMAAFEGVLHARRTDPKVGAWLAAAEAPDAAGARMLELIARAYGRNAAVPARLAAEIARVTSVAQGTWAEARARDDVAHFLPTLARVIALRREEAAALAENGALYDALLADYVGRPVRRSEEIGRNSRPKRRATHFTPDALDSLSHDWLLRFAEMAEGLGYPDDAAMIEKSAAGRAAG